MCYLVILGTRSRSTAKWSQALASFRNWLIEGLGSGNPWYVNGSGEGRSPPQREVALIKAIT